MALLERTASGIRPTHDTWPADGVGGVRGSGEGLPFFVGGYCSSGCAGALPLGTHELTTGPAQASSFFSTLSADLLATMAAKERAPADEPSPKSVVGFDFEEEVRVDDELRRDHVAWQEFGTTD